MNNQNQLNIQAVIIERVKGVRYKVNGHIVAINENDNTCSMRINGKIEKNIPLNKVYVNEGIIDDIKNVGKAAVEKIKDVVKKVKGFFIFNNDVNTARNLANLAIAQDMGILPQGLKFVASKTVAKFAGVTPLSIDDVAAEADERESAEGVKFFGDLMKRYGTTDETIEESVAYIRRKYFGEALNEDVINPRGENVKFNTVVDLKSAGGENPIYGENVNTRRLRDLIQNNIEGQIITPDDEEDMMIDTTKHKKGVLPLLIWGAPGIGKSAIVLDVIKTMSKKWGGELNVQNVDCSNMTEEKWGLPKHIIEKIIANDVDGEEMVIHMNKVVDVTKSWLPLVPQTGDAKQTKLLNDLYNNGKFLVGGQENNFYGGVIFFDEVARMSPNCFTILMGLITGNTIYAGYSLATKWGCIFAANRGSDMGQEETVTNTERAQHSRFTHVNFVPSRAEWLKWARRVNPKSKEANIPEIFCEFIQRMGDSVWYATIANGAYDGYFGQDISKKKDIQDAYEKNTKFQDKLKGDAFLKQNGLDINPRSWQNVAKDYTQMIKKLVGRRQDYYDLLAKSTKTNANGDEIPEGYIPNRILIPFLEDKYRKGVDSNGNNREIYATDFLEAFGVNNYFTLSGRKDGEGYSDNDRGTTNHPFVDKDSIRLSEDDDDGSYATWGTKTAIRDIIDGWINRLLYTKMGVSKHNPVYNKWEEYHSWFRYYTPENIQSILTTSHMSNTFVEGEKYTYQQMDETPWNDKSRIAPPYKEDALVIQEICQELIVHKTPWEEIKSNYMMDKNYNSKATDYPSNKKEQVEYEKLLDKYNKLCTIETSKGPLNLLDVFDDDKKKVCIYMIENAPDSYGMVFNLCVYIRRLLNTAKNNNMLSVFSEMLGEQLYKYGMISRDAMPFKMLDIGAMLRYNTLK